MAELLDIALPEALGVLLIGTNSSALCFLLIFFSLDFTKTLNHFRNAGCSEKPVKYFLFAFAFNGLGRFRCGNEFPQGRSDCGKFTKESSVRPV